MYKSVLSGLVAAGLLATAAPLAIAPASAAEYTMRYSDIGSPRGPRAAALKWWAKELNTRSKGRIEIKFFWSQSLVKGKATAKAIGSGLAEMGTVLGLYTPADFPVWNYANTPFTIENMWFGMRTWQELRQTQKLLRDETRKKNVRMLFNNSAGPVHLLTTKKPITSTGDLKGMKIRSTGVFTHLFKALGAVPVKIGFGELYSALDRGTIDGTINYTPFVKSYKHYEVAGHLTETNMGQLLGYGGGINNKLFNRMPKDIHDILLKTSDEYVDVYARIYEELSVVNKKELIAGIDGKKVVFHALPAATRSEWAAKSEVFTADWLKKMEKKGVDGAKFIAAFNATHQKYKNILKNDGYPWSKTN